MSKKTIIALAALTAMAGSALAADVTLYGRIDNGLYLTKSKAKDTTSLSMESGMAGASRWGIKGTEDLGNGYKVGFVLESGINTDTGTYAGSKDSRLFDRDSYLSVGTPFGDFRLGRSGALGGGVSGGIFAGNESAKYLDGVVEPSAAPDPRTFYVQSIGGIATVALQRIGSAPTVSLEYSLGDDDQWDAYQFGSDPIELSPGQFVRFRAPADGVNVHFASESSKCHQFAFTGKVAIGGDILSLLYKDPTGKKAFPGSSTWQFGYLFCYRGMFSGCSAMETAPSLPAQSLSNYCYASMFNGCTAIKRVAADFEAFSSASATSSWLNGVADTGVFHCKEGLVIESRSVNTVPEGWEIKRDRG